MMVARMASMFFMPSILRVQKQCQGVNIDPSNQATRLNLATWIDPWHSTWKLDQARSWQLPGYQALTWQSTWKSTWKSRVTHCSREGASLAPSSSLELHMLTNPPMQLPTNHATNDRAEDEHGVGSYNYSSNSLAPVKLHHMTPELVALIVSKPTGQLVRLGATGNQATVCPAQTDPTLWQINS